MDMGPRSRCRRKTLTTHKSGFQPLFSSSAPFSCRRRQNGCSKASDIAGPAAKLAVTVSVDSCRFFPADPLLPRPAACLLAASRTCPCQALALSAQGGAGVRPRRCPAPCSPEETVGFMSPCLSAAPATIVYGLCTYIKSGSPPEGLFPPSPAHSPRSSYSSVSGIRNRVRISWRLGRPTGGQGRIYLTARHALP